MDDSGTANGEVAEARARLADAALVPLSKEQGSEADYLRFVYAMERDSARQASEIPSLRVHRKLGRTSIQAERLKLERIRAKDELSSAAYLELQEELDWIELTSLRDSDRNID